MNVEFFYKAEKIAAFDSTKTHALAYMYKSTPDLTVVSKSPLSVVVNSSTHAAIIFSLAKGMLSINVCIGVFP